MTAFFCAAVPWEVMVMCAYMGTSSGPFFSLCTCFFWGGDGGRGVCFEGVEVGLGSSCCPYIHMYIYINAT